MSHYSRVKTQFRHHGALTACLKNLGYEVETDTVIRGHHGERLVVVRHGLEFDPVHRPVFGHALQFEHRRRPGVPLVEHLVHEVREAARQQGRRGQTPDAESDDDDVDMVRQVAAGVPRADAHTATFARRRSDMPGGTTSLVG